MCLPMVVEPNWIAEAFAAAHNCESVVCFLAGDQQPSGRLAEWDVDDLSILRRYDIWLRDTWRPGNGIESAVAVGHLVCCDGVRRWESVDG